MKYYLIFVLGFVTILIANAEPVRKSLNVTVYNSDLGVIRDTRELDLNQGISEIILEDVAERIDATSVHIKLDAKVLEQNFKYDLISMYKILSKYINRKIQLIAKDGKFIEAELLSVSDKQIVLKKDDGGLIMLPNLMDYQINVGKLPEGLITKPALQWMVDAKNTKKQNVELSYMTNGLTWHAEYVAVLNNDDSKLDLNSWVSINNQSGASYPDAQLKLVAGNVNLVQDSYNRYELMKTSADFSDAAGSQFIEKQFFEYHIYNLQRQSTIANNETKQISLFEAQNVLVKKKYLLKNSGWSNENSKVQVVIEFENKAKNNLGMPMPQGKVRLYKTDGKSLEFIGEDRLEHTAKDEKVSLKVGDAFDIVAEIVLTDENKISDRVVEKTYTVKVKNHKNEDVNIDIERFLGSNWQITKSNINYVKKDAGSIIFELPVKSNNESKLEYTVRYRY